MDYIWLCVCVWVCESVCVHIICTSLRGLVITIMQACIYVCVGAIEFEFAKLADYIQVQ